MGCLPRLKNDVFLDDPTGDPLTGGTAGFLRSMVQYYIDKRLSGIFFVGVYIIIIYINIKIIY